MNHHSGQFESTDQVVEWCKMALTHENNPSRDARRCVYIYILDMYTRYFYSRVQIYIQSSIIFLRIQKLKIYNLNMQNKTRVKSHPPTYSFPPNIM